MHSTQSKHIQRSVRGRSGHGYIRCIALYFRGTMGRRSSLGLNTGGFSGGEVVSALAVDYHVRGTCAMQP
jgi:hypothetical protein